MSASKILVEQTENVTRNFVKELNHEEKQILLVWSQKALNIKNNSDLSNLEKIIAISKLENQEPSKVIMSKLIKTLKNKVWTNQSWARRLGFIGLGTGFTFGGAAVGIATMGAGIGVPLAIMTAAGGVVLGAAIDEITKELK